MKVFISGPYTNPDLIKNVTNAVHVANRLVELGHTPFVPHLYHLWEQITPHNYEYWMQLCLAWVESCAAILRLPGKSKGADREVALAVELGLDVYDWVDGEMKLRLLPGCVGCGCAQTLCTCVQD